jgi:hypothetical protein
MAGKNQFGFHRSDGLAIQIPRIMSVASIQDIVSGFEGPAALRRIMQSLWKYAAELDERGFFASPVQIEGYQAVVATPMDLSLIQRRLERSVYRTLEAFEADLLLLSENCFLFNEDHSEIFKVIQCDLFLLCVHLMIILPCGFNFRPRRDCNSAPLSR